MKKDTTVIVFVLGVIVAAITGYYFLVKQGDPSGFLDWLKSMVRQIGVKANNLFSGDAISKAVDLIAGFEGFSAKPYWDVDGYSIGYGHHFISGDGYTVDSIVTEEQAWQQLMIDVQGFLNCIQGSFHRQPTNNQAAAMISLAYNIGCGAFTSSTLIQKFNAGDLEGAAQQFSVWRISGGVINKTLEGRRSDEQEVFLEG